MSSRRVRSSATQPKKGGLKPLGRAMRVPKDDCAGLTPFSVVAAAGPKMSWRHERLSCLLSPFITPVSRLAYNWMSSYCRVLILWPVVGPACSVNDGLRNVSNYQPGGSILISRLFKCGLSLFTRLPEQKLRRAKALLEARTALLARSSSRRRIAMAEIQKETKPTGKPYNRCWKKWRSMHLKEEKATTHVRTETS